MSVHDAKMSLLEDDACAKVVATTAACVPPRSETWVMGKASRRMKKDGGLVEPPPVPTVAGGLSSQAHSGTARRGRDSCAGSQPV